MVNMPDTIRQALLSALSHPLVDRAARLMIPEFVPIFFLHRSYDANRKTQGLAAEYLAESLQYLSDNDFHHISLETLIEAIREQSPLPARSVVFCMDDGFYDQGDKLGSVFADFHVPATFFVLTDFVDSEGWPWDSKVNYIVNHAEADNIQLTIEGESIGFMLETDFHKSQTRRRLRDLMKSQPGERIDEILAQLVEASGVTVPEEPPAWERPANWDQLRHLESRGLRIAPHSRSHRILSTLSDAECEHEIRYSTERVKAELKDPAPVFCYPTGRETDFGDREIEIVKSLGFTGAVSSIPGSARKKPPMRDYIYQLPRYELPEDPVRFHQYNSWVEAVRS